MRKYVLLILVQLITNYVVAQMKVGINSTVQREASVLELEHTGKGLAFPRVSLNGVNNASPLSSDLLEGTTIYNTNAGLPGGTGLYLWNNSSWRMLLGNVARNGLKNTINHLELGGDLEQNTNVPLSNYNLFFNGVGNIGVGVSNASAKLVVNASASYTGALKLSVPTSFAGDQWWMGFNHGANSEDSTDRARIGVDIGDGGGGRLFFTTGYEKTQQERLRIDQQGNVGIGTNAPTRSLDINGTVRLRTISSENIIATDANGNLGFGSVTNAITKSTAGVKLGGNLGQDTRLEAGGSGNALSVSSGYNWGGPFTGENSIGDYIPNDLWARYIPSYFWQSYLCEHSGLLKIVNVAFYDDQTEVGLTNFTVQIYEGVGTEGKLLGESFNSYNQISTVRWFRYNLNFNFEVPVILVKGRYYTLRVSANKGFTPIVYQNYSASYLASEPWQEGFFYNFTNYILKPDGNPISFQIKNGIVALGVGNPSPNYRLDIADNPTSSSVLLRNGNGSSESSKSQVAFGYNGSAQYKHAIKSRHNGGMLTGNAIDFYVWNFGTDDVNATGTKRVMTVDGGGNNNIGTLEVNGILKRQTFSQSITVNGNGSVSYSWVHNLGYRPVIMIVFDQTSSGYLDYCNVSYAHVNNNQLNIYVTNRNINQASGSIKWIVVQ
jgi:hypothetical protein